MNLFVLRVNQGSMCQSTPIVPVSRSEGVRRYTWQDVAQHNAPNDCWMSIRDKVSVDQFFEFETYRTCRFMMSRIGSKSTPAVRT